jgi:hypothetical protein
MSSKRVLAVGSRQGGGSPGMLCHTATAGGAGSGGHRAVLAGTSCHVFVLRCFSRLLGFEL